MTGHGHDPEKVIPCFPKIVEGTMAKVMEGEIFDLCRFTGRLKTVLDFIKGLSISKKYPVCVKSSR